MTKVDPKGRIVLPQQIRERLGFTAGTEVEIHEEEGKAVVEPVPVPEQVIERVERLVEETASSRGQRAQIDHGDDPIAQKHRNAVRRGAETSTDG